MLSEAVRLINNIMRKHINSPLCCGWLHKNIKLNAKTQEAITIKVKLIHELLEDIKKDSLIISHRLSSIKKMVKVAY